MIDIDKMEAGHEFDALIAEKVMSIQHARLDDGCHWSCRVCNPPPFSRSIAAAWEVVEKVKRMWALHYLPDHKIWQASFIDETPILTVEADTAALAICRAAIKKCE